jgi:hypothetical protein
MHSAYISTDVGSSVTFQKIEKASVLSWRKKGILDFGHTRPSNDAST